jgi:arylsulfatase
MSGTFRGWRFVGAATMRTAGFALLVGGGAAALDLWSRVHVREFRTGDPAGFGERASAWVQRTAVESFGFGALALLAAFVVWATRPRDARVAFGRWWCAAGALWVFGRHGTYLGEEFVRFLRFREVLVLDALGLAALFAALLAVVWCARQLPWGRAADPASTGCAAALIAAFGSELWRDALRSSGITSTHALATAAGTALVALLASAALSGLVAHVERFFVRLATVAAWRRLVHDVVPVALLVVGVAGAALALRGDERPAPAYERLASRRPDGAGPRHVVLIVVDTLRADALGCYGYSRPTSPTIDALANAGTLFEDVTSAASWTKPSTATLLSGLFPSRHGALHHGSSLRTPDGLPTLAESFRAAGFATAGFVSNPNVKAIFDFDRGFDTYFDAPVEDTVSAAALRDSHFGRLLVALTRHQFNWNYENNVFSMNEHVLAFLRANADEDVFLYVHYIDPHTPYSPPERWRREFEQDHPGFPIHNERRRLVGRDLYDAEVRTTDEGLLQLFDEMRALGTFDETLIALTSDHGEEFDEKGLFEHGFSIYQAEVFVPLILHGPGVAAQRVAEPIATVHLPATLLDLAGAPQDLVGDERRFGDGLSVADVVRGRDTTTPNPGFVENEFNMSQRPDPDFVLRGLRDGPLKLIVTLESRYRPVGKYPGFELYDLAKDPGELVNLFDLPEQAERTEALLERLDAHWKFLEARGLRDGEALELTDEMKRQLQALGYLEEDGD